MIEGLKNFYRSGDTEKRIGFLMAGFLLLILVLWIVTGAYEARSGVGASADVSDTNSDAEVGVRFVVSKAVMRHQFLTRAGTTQPKSEIEVVAKRSGEVIKIGKKEGTRVRKGDLLFKIDARDLAARKQQLEVNRKRIKLQQESTNALVEKGLQSELGKAVSDASIADIEAQIKLLEIEIEGGEILAPVSGVYQKSFLEEGSYARLGMIAAKILVLDPIVIRTYVSQQEIQELRQSSEVQVLATVADKEIGGKIARTSYNADPQTRSFEVDVEVSNEDAAISGGFSAEVRFQMNTKPYHAIRISWLTLNEGDIGVKYIDEDEFVRFYKVEVEDTSGDITWASGLPDEIKIVTLGQSLAKLDSEIKSDIDDRY